MDKLLAGIIVIVLGIAAIFLFLAVLSAVATVAAIGGIIYGSVISAMNYSRSFWENVVQGSEV